MRILVGLMVVCGLLVVGCTKPDAPLADSGGKAGNGSPTQQEPIAPEPGSGSEDDPRDQAAKIRAAMTPKPEAVAINPEQKEWKEAKVAAPVVEKTLGQKLDDGFEALPPTFINVQIECTDRGSILKFSPSIRIQDTEHFSIEYALPESKGVMNSLTADGKRRARFESEQVTDLPPLGKREVQVKMNRAQIENFAKRMPVEAFRYWSHGDRPWSALFAGLNDPANKFKVDIKEMESDPSGPMRKFYRVIAESQSGNPLKIEMVVDSRRYVPVVFRTNLTYPDGKERMMVWRSEWGFGDNHETDSFKIPLQPK